MKTISIEDKEELDTRNKTIHIKGTCSCCDNLTRINELNLLTVQETERELLKKDAEKYWNANGGSSLLNFIQSLTIK